MPVPLATVGVSNIHHRADEHESYLTKPWQGAPVRELVRHLCTLISKLHLCGGGGVGGGQACTVDIDKYL